MSSAVPVRVAGAVAALLALISPAVAHSGGHSHMSLTELVVHLAEPWHAGPLVMAVAVGLVAYVVGRRRATARASARQSEERT